MSLFDDGALLAYERPEANCAWKGEGWLPASYRVGSLSVGESQVALWPDTTDLVPGDHPRQVGRAAVGGDWATWAETDSTNVQVDNWRVFSRDTTGGTTYLVAKAEELTEGAGDLPFYESTFTILDDRAYWSSAPKEAASGSKTWVPQIVSKSLTGQGALEVVTENADQPVATSKGIVVRTTADVEHIVQDEFGDPVAEQSPVPVVLALVTSEGVEPLLTVHADRPLQPNERISGLAAHGNHVSFAVADTAYLVDLRTNEVTGFPGVGAGIAVPDATIDGDAHREATTVNATAVSDEIFAWTFGGGAATGELPAYVYDMEDGTLSRVDVPRNFGDVWVGGSFVGWRSLETGTTVAQW